MKEQLAKTVFKSLEVLSEKLGIPIERDLMNYHFLKERIRILPYSFVKKNKVLPLKEERGIIFVAVNDPFDIDIIDEIRYITGTDIQELLSTESAIDEAIEHCYQQKDNEASEYIQGLENDPLNGNGANDKDTEYDLLENESDSSVIKLLNIIIMEAIGQQASDIHFEPIEHGLLVRYRIDGIMHVKHTLTSDMQAPLITRLKVLSQLDIAETRLPQDGRIKLKMAGREIDFRVSTIPIVFGERVVLRIMDRTQVMLGFEHLGMGTVIKEKMTKSLSNNQGIILVTGPTGSGKTTTLYAALTKIKSQVINIMTIEEPVEFKLQGMAQINVNPKIGLSFATGLRHILRQDPDVIMIGEIRDKETAEIAIQASLTGHLVFSTLHTNDASSAVARLVDMGVEPYLLASSLTAVLAQRLVRRLCPHCKTEYSPTEAEAIDFKKIFDNAEPEHLYKGSGCDKCFGSGYKGRCGLYELMSISPDIKKQMSKSVDTDEIRRIAASEGMTSIMQEGLTLVISGETTLEEVLRVTTNSTEYN